MKKLMLGLVTLVLVTGGLMASGAKEETRPIRWLGVQHTWTDEIVKRIPEFEQETGLKVQFESYTEEQLANKVSVEAAAKSKNLDVMNFRPLQQSLIFYNNGWAQPLNEYFADDTEFDVADLSPAALGSCTVNGDTIAIPLITEAHVMYYNKLLFEEKGLEPPKTLEEMYNTAELMTDKANGYYGVVSRGQRSAAVTQFSTYLQNFGGDFMTNGKASIDTPEAIAAFTFYGDMLRNFGPPGVLNMSWPQAADIFSQGKVAMYTDANSLYNAVASPENSKIAGNVGVAMMPEGPAGTAPYNVCSWALAVGSNSDNKDAAWELVRWLTSKENMAIAQKAGNTMARQSAWTDPANNVAFTDDFIAVSGESAKIGSPYDRPLVIHVQEARDIIGAVIVTGIEGGDVAAHAKSANIEFQTLLDNDNK